MTDAAGELTEVVRAHGRRRHRSEAGALALRLSSPAALLAALAAVTVQTGLVSLSSALIAALVVLLALSAAVLAAALRPVNDVSEAKRLDDALRLKDRLSSALSFLSRRERTPFEQAAVLDARRFLSEARSHRSAGPALRRPLSALAAALVTALVLIAAAHIVRPAPASHDERKPSAAAAEAHDQADDHAKAAEEPAPERSDEGLVEVEETKLTEDAAGSTLSGADLEAMAALGAMETSEADRLLAQAAYLDETELDDSGLGREPGAGDDRVTMKEPDIDMIREMVKEAQQRKKEGRDQGEAGDDLKLEVLIKSHAASARQSGKRPSGQTSSGGGGGPSEDTRIQPRRVRVDAREEFKVTSMRSLTPASAADAGRIVLSEAIMRTSGVPQPPLVDARPGAPTPNPVEPAPLVTQSVPADLRAYVSKYFEGLRQLLEAP